MGKIIKWSVVFLIVFLLNACRFSHTPQITTYEPSDSEADLLNAAGIPNYYFYKYNLNDKKLPTKLQFWIDLYDKGQKVDKIERTFDFKGLGNKGKIALLIPEAGNQQLQTYRIAIGERLEASSVDTLSDIGTLNEKLSGLSESGINPQADIKYDQPIILAVEVYSFKKEMAPIDKQIYTKQSAMDEVKKDNVVIVFKCQFSTK